MGDRAGFSRKNFFAQRIGKVGQKQGFLTILKNPYEGVHDNSVFLKNVFHPKNWENWPKIGFLNLKKNLVINLYLICSIMKMYIICYVPAQIPYLEKFWFLRYGPKCPQPIRLQDFLINHIPRTNVWNSLIFCMLIQVHINWKLIKKLLDWHGQKCMWLVCSQDSKVGHISRMNWRNELVFCIVVQIQESRKLFQWFLDEHGQKRAWRFISWDPKICWISLWI